MLSAEDKVLAIKRYREDFPLFARNCLSILDKSGKSVPLILNRAQSWTHERIEEQLARIGRVRALVLKGRQQGLSTYIGGRFYAKTTFNFGTRAFIVAHEQKATDNLFTMVKRYHDHNPLAPSTGATNAKELVFDLLDGGYKLATAGTKDVGRSNTAQLLHGSEFGFWDNAQMHLAGIGNTIGDIPGTEIILESTANGRGNAFHTMWQDAEAGKSEYMPIFVPWYWQDEYRATPDPKLDLSEEDVLYMQAYGLDMAQMQWRRNKIATYGAGFEWLFVQEYPATPSEAFVSSTRNPLIAPTVVSRAANNLGYSDQQGVVIIGCDPAGDGENSDRTAIVWRRGRTVLRVETYDNKDEMQVAGILADYWLRGNGRGVMPDGIVIDKGGLGAGIYSRLRELNIPAHGVMFGERAQDDELYADKRSEIWWRMQQWFADYPNRIPPDPELISDLSAPAIDDLDSSGRKKLESKKSMRKRGIRSPDAGDALALTFAIPIAPRASASTVQAASGRHAAGNAGY
jgi:hypothetical protein